jgi:hypothetical protein
MDAPTSIFVASRLTRGNLIFPTQVEISPTSVTLRKPHLVGKLEESIHMAHVASIKILTGWFFSDVVIESTSGKDPMVCHGHHKGDAVEMKALIEQFQSEYYRGDQRAPSQPAS